MAERCPECLAEMPEDDAWICGACGYTLRTPLTSKIGIAFMIVGSILLGTFVLGPENLGLRSGLVPTDLADLTIANYPLLVASVFFLGMLLTAAGAVKVRGERARVAV